MHCGEMWRKFRCFRSGHRLRWQAEARTWNCVECGAEIINGRIISEFAESFPLGCEPPRPIGADACLAYKYTEVHAQADYPLPPYSCDRQKGHAGDHCAHLGSYGEPVLRWSPSGEVVAE